MFALDSSVLIYIIGYILVAYFAIYFVAVYAGPMVLGQPAYYGPMSGGQPMPPPYPMQRAFEVRFFVIMYLFNCGLSYKIPIQLQVNNDPRLISRVVQAISTRPIV